MSRLQDDVGHAATHFPGTFAEESKSLSTTEIERRQAKDYTLLLESLLKNKPIYRRQRPLYSFNVGTIDDEAISASLSRFEGSLAQGGAEWKAYEARRAQTRNAAYSSFTILDFHDPIPPCFMEAAASLICSCIHQHSCLPRRRLMPKPNFIISASVRGCGALAHAASQQLNLPYSLCNWYPNGTAGDVFIHQCEGVGGMGSVYINSVPPESAIVVVVDKIGSDNAVKKLVSALRKLEGVAVLGIYSILDMVQPHCNPRTELAGTPVWSLFNVHLDGELTRLSRTTPDAALGLPEMCVPLRHMLSSTIYQLKQLPSWELQKKIIRVASLFSGISLEQNQDVEYPFCHFPLTDFKPVLSPGLIEDIADLVVYYGDFERSEVLVADCDRAGAPLVHAISVRTNLPYVIASWNLTSLKGGAVADVEWEGTVETHSRLTLCGIRPGTRCTVVDEMLTGGGAQGALLKAIMALGAHPIEAIFASERLYPVEGKCLPVRLGKNKLKHDFPETTVTCIIQFMFGAEKTEQPPSRVGA